MTPVISVVTLAWRNEEYANGFLASLTSAWRAAGQPAIELVVVENGHEGTAAATRLRESDDGTLVPVVIRLANNTGFSGGSNVGVAEAVGEILVVVNLDLEFDERFLIELTKMSSGRWDLLVPAVLPLDPLAGPVNAGPGRRRLLHRHAWISPAPSMAQPVQAGTGSCLILRRCTIERRQADVGGLFDAEYHSFYEDVDLFWWAERHGMHSLYDPALVVRHALAGSFGGRYKFASRPPDVQQRVMANWRITVWKNARSSREWLGWLVGEVAYFGQAIVAAGPAGTGRYLGSWIDAVRDSRAIHRRRGTFRA